MGFKCCDELSLGSIVRLSLKSCAAPCGGQAAAVSSGVVGSNDPASCFWLMALWYTRGGPATDSSTIARCRTSLASGDLNS